MFVELERILQEHPKMGALVVAEGGVRGAIDFTSLIQAVVKFLKEFQISPDQVDALTKYVLDLFDRYVVPYDIPGVPAFLEKIAEAALRRQIPEIIANLVRTVKPNPGSMPPTIGSVGDQNDSPNCGKSCEENCGSEACDTSTTAPPDSTTTTVAPD